jgi:recombinational DNA repair protein RecT
MENKSQAIELFKSNDESFKAMGLRKDIAYSDWRNSALMLIENDRSLQGCFASKAGQISLINSLKMAAVTRLSLNPLLGYACIIARKNKNGEMIACYQTEKNGLVKLASDATYTVDSLTVYENDEIKIKHSAFTDIFDMTPCLKSRGQVIGYVSRAVSKRKDNDFVRVHYMSVEQVLEHACKTASSYDVRSLLYKIRIDKGIDSEIKSILNDRNIDFQLKQSSWIRFFHGMGEKTVVKALLSKPCFSSIMNVTAGLEDIQEQFIETGEAITVEVINEGNENTKRHLDIMEKNKNQKQKQTAAKPVKPEGKTENKAPQKEAPEKNAPEKESRKEEAKEEIEDPFV